MQKQYEVNQFSTVKIGSPGKVFLSQGETESLKIDAPENFLEVLEVICSNDTLTIRMEPKSFWKSLFKNLFNTFDDHVTYHLVVKDLSALSVGGSIRLEAEPLTFEQLSLSNSGSVRANFSSLNLRDDLSIRNSGSVKLSMKALSANAISIHNSGAVNAVVDQLQADSLEVRASGSMRLEAAGKVNSEQFKISGSARVDAVQLESDSVEVTISGSGSAKVWAKSSLNSTISGSGSIKFKGEPTTTQRISGSGSITRIKE